MSARDQQIRALYRAALERQPSERASFIADVSGGDEELKASIELLLSKDGATELRTRVSAAGDAEELAVGTVLGQYRIEGVLGRGGIGVVYRATDTKLNRPVAIKFLSSVVTDDDVRRRFKQEAETTSALNHPHIVTVHDVGEHEGQQYIVSELVDGGTLDDWSRATRKRSWRLSVELLTGVADALAVAHIAGVLHRDVKPGNILIGSNGYAKLADFGLAKLVGTGGNDPLRHSQNTRAGVVVGTVAYMSPEQAAGLALDARSDVFSFGIVLYELLAGRRPFDSANDLETLKAIAHATPAPLPDGTPELLRMAIDKALEKEPSDRYQTMRDFVADLKRVTRKGSATPAAAKTRDRTRVPWLVAAALGIALVAALIPAARNAFKAPAPLPPRLAYEIATGHFHEGGIAISPDGTKVAYVASGDGAHRIAVRTLATGQTSVLTDTKDAVGPFWSPDSRSLAFYSGHKLRRIDLSGGPARVLWDRETPTRFPGSWSRDGTILFPVSALQETGFTLAIARVSENSGGATVLPTDAPVDGHVAQLFPQVLPDQKHFVYLNSKPPDFQGVLRVGAIDEPTRRPITPVTYSVAYANGFLLYHKGTTLFAQRFDADALALRGEAMPVAENVDDFSVSQNGVIVYDTPPPAEGSGEQAPMRQLVWVDRAGRPLGVADAARSHVELPQLSPDGSHVAIAVLAGSDRSRVWTVDVQRGSARPLTLDAGVDAFPIWSPDGERIAFGSSRDGSANTLASIYQRAANGAGSDEVLLKGMLDERLTPSDWSHDGRYILFGRTRWGSDTNSVWVLPTTGDEAHALLESPSHRTFGARLSPDGRWIAYATNESGVFQVVVRHFPDVNRGQWSVSVQDGIFPRWRADGRELYYQSTDGVMAVDVKPGDTWDAGTPHKLFSIPGGYVAGVDGERFLVSEPLPTAASAPTENKAAAPDATIHVIANWTSGLDTK
jgi:serine/threonine protein kinase/Tol biopolymer transport system component